MPNFAQDIAKALNIRPTQVAATIELLNGGFLRRGEVDKVGSLCPSIAFISPWRETKSSRLRVRQIWELFLSQFFVSRHKTFILTGR